MTNIVATIENRHSVKAYDPNKKISDAQWGEICDLLQMSPSSINIQPWHFIVAKTDEAKARLAKAAYGKFAYNAPSIEKASHVVLFCARTDIDEGYVDAVVAQEAADGRYANDEVKNARAEMMGNYVQARKAEGQLGAWAQNQVYINLGFLLMGVAAMGVDATPMEGVDLVMLDEEFGLAARGMRASFVVTLGFLDAQKDYNNDLPKSRLSQDVIIEEI